MRHVMRKIKGLCLFGIFFIGIMLFPAPSQAETHSFDFSDGLGSCCSFHNPTGLFTLNDTSGELRLVKSEDTVEGIIKSGKICSNSLIGGDFDISVHYKLNIPLQNGDQLQFHLYSKNFSYDIVRSNEGGFSGDNYHVWFNGHAEPIHAITTTDTSGTLRFVRIGNEVSAYFMSEGASEYTRIDSQVFDPASVRICMVLQNQPHSHSALDASFDYLRIEADQISPIQQITVSGTLSCKHWTSGNIYIHLLDRSGTMKGFPVLQPGSYTVDASDYGVGTPIMVCAMWDANGDHKFSPGDWVCSNMTSGENPFFPLSSGDNHADINLTSQITANLHGTINCNDYTSGIIYIRIWDGPDPSTAHLLSCFPMLKLREDGTYSTKAANVPVGSSIWVTAWWDADADGMVSAGDSVGSYSENPVILQEEMEGLDITLRSPSPSVHRVGLCDQDCQANAPLKVSGDELDVCFNYTGPVNILAGVLSDDFKHIWWLKPDCSLDSDYSQAVDSGNGLSCEEISMPVEGGYLFWLVSPVDLSQLDWENGIYELLFYQVP